MWSKNKLAYGKPPNGPDPGE